VILPEERSFIAGADVDDCFHHQPGHREHSPREAAFQAIADLPTRPAAIDGVCLGGGWSWLSPLHARRERRPEVQLGLPEVRLGILPGFGGTQRPPG
jgi:enoyl-CoA hydratase/carnithine racemase